jgi:hypothetical protein
LALFICKFFYRFLVTPFPAETITFVGDTAAETADAFEIAALIDVTTFVTVDTRAFPFVGRTEFTRVYLVKSEADWRRTGI